MEHLRNDMKGYATLQTAIIGRIVQIPNHRGIGRGPISPRTPIYRKCVKRREKTETIKSPGISIQVLFIGAVNVLLNII